MSIAALIGGRLYHVIDQWALYANDPLKIILPPYSGLGVFGGIVTGTLAAWWYARRRGVSFARWADIIAPALFVMQAIGRWGNYFNQELYGPPTTAPWGIPSTAPTGSPSIPATRCPRPRVPSAIPVRIDLGADRAAFLVFLGYRLRSWLRPGDLLLTFFIWYGVTRFALETLRADNWTFFGVPTAQIVSLAFIAIGVVGMVLRHRGSRMGDKPPTDPQRATWGALGAAWMTRPIDEPWAHVGDRIDDEGGDDDEGDNSADGAIDDEIDETAAADEPEPSVDGDAAAPDQTEPRPGP